MAFLLRHLRSLVFVALEACSYFHARLVGRDLVLQPLYLVKLATSLSILDLFFDFSNLSLLVFNVIFEAGLMDTTPWDFEQLVNLRIDLTSLIVAQLAVILRDSISLLGKSR